ncbi:MAG TPA: hypothetical protein VHD90_10950 [Phototrophicaceae bacterium]|nr:hypothetical protein [Phototrophicaceae bacterium]
MIIPLSHTYTGKDGAPAVFNIDLDIFLKRYFTHCMECCFCHDRCCTFGADIDVENVSRLDEAVDTLEAYLHIPRAEWFTGIVGDDPDYPGKRFTRTKVNGGVCVFLNPAGRGCLIHRFCLENGIDYHLLKPRACWLFPITFDTGVLRPSVEIQDGSLICMNQGTTLYQAAREEIHYLLGDALIEELDQLERQILNVSNSTSEQR